MESWAGSGTNYELNNAYLSCIFDVEDTSTHKVKFGVYASGANSLVYGHSDRQGTAAYFMRLGDT